MKARDDESLDPRLQAYLKLLRPVPRRDALAAARAKANFLVELEGLYEPDQPPRSGFLTYPARWLAALYKLGSYNPIPRTALSLSAILLIIVLLLFGWAGVTARAAETSLPGDTLYSFKTGIEQVEVAFAVDLDKQAGLYIEFASHRLHEIQSLVESGRYEKAVALSAKFRFNIQKALDITNNLAKVNPARAAQRLAEIDAELAGFTAQLDGLLVKIPPSYQPAFNNVIPTLHTGTPTPVAPALTQTPDPTGELDIPQIGNPNEQNNLEDDSDADLNNASDGGSITGNPSGESSNDDAGTTIQEGTDGNSGLNTDPGSGEEGRGENVDPEQSGSEHPDDAQDEQNSTGHEDGPSENEITNSVPAPSHN